MQRTTGTFDIMCQILMALTGEKKNWIMFQDNYNLHLHLVRDVAATVVPSIVVLLGGNEEDR